jgi:hypothetical protein
VVGDADNESGTAEVYTFVSHPGDKGFFVSENKKYFI